MTIEGKAGEVAMLLPFLKGPPEAALNNSLVTSFVLTLVQEPFMLGS